MISLTLKAQEKLAEFLKQDASYKYVRIGVRGGGCSGFEYTFALTGDSKPEWDVLQFDNITIVVDPISSMYLDGVIVDYVESLLDSGFKFTNPAVKATCGCGKSFSV